MLLSSIQKMRAQFAKILTRYLAGDSTMVQEPEVVNHLQLQVVSFDVLERVSPGTTEMTYMRERVSPGQCGSEQG